MHVEVDDRDAGETELGLGVPGRDCDAVDEAEAHRALRQRMVTGRAHERETAPIHGLERDPGGEPRRPPRGLARERVAVELGRLGEVAKECEVCRSVHPRQLLLAREPLDRLAVQGSEPLLPLRMRAGRMQPRELRIRQELDAASSAASRSESRRSPHSPVSSAARPHVGV